ncbi:MAG: glutathione peroxidase [Cyanobacteria bacterium REEB67]|nr:glutathione peroxidase [Cyanobacteria bacterium REEB67]
MAALLANTSTVLTNAPALAAGKVEDNKNGNSKPAKLALKTAAQKSTADFYKFKARALDGQEIALDKYKGDVVLIVNTASECGFTPQYQGLEELNKKYATRGLRVLGFPCNQFGGQEPGDSKAIASFCHKNYGVDFQMFEKIDVNGDKADPLYHYLTSATGNAPIKWNFTKFLIDRKGKIVKRFESNVTPKEISTDIEKQL